MNWGEAALTPEAVADAFARGETAVSLGLVAFLDQGENGLEARVYGPSWNLAKRLVVFANGEVIAANPKLLGDMLRKIQKHS